MQNKNLILIIIGGLILLGLGYGYGYFSGQKAIEGTKTETPLSGLLESKAIGELTTTASGEVTEISGRKLTLNKEGDTLTISIGEDALVYRVVPSEEKATEIPQPSVREEIKFGEIKVGDKVSITCELKADGSLEGKTVIILSTI